MPKPAVAKLSEFVVTPARFFHGHGHKEPEYHALFGVFHNIQARVESSLDARFVEVATPGLWKFYIQVADTGDASLPADDCFDGVLQSWLRIDRAAFDAAGPLLDQKHYVAGILADHVRDLGTRFGFDASGLVELLRGCTREGEIVEFRFPVAPVKNASSTREAQWAVTMSFRDTTIAADLRDGESGGHAHVALIRFVYPGYGLVAMFLSTIRWTGDRKVLLRSRPVTDVLYGDNRVSVLLGSGPGVRFRRAPENRPEWFRFEWRLDLRDPAWTKP